MYIDLFVLCKRIETIIDWLFEMDDGCIKEEILEEIKLIKIQLKRIESNLEKE